MPFTAHGLTNVTNSFRSDPVADGHPRGSHQRDGHVDGVDAGVLADVIGHVLAHAHHGVAGAYARGLGFAGEGAVGTEGHGERGARQVDDTRLPLRRATSSSNCAGSSVDARMTSGCEGLRLRGEVGAEIGVGHHVDLDAGALEDDDTIRRMTALTPRVASASRYCVVSGVAEDADARHHAALVAARGQGFEQEAVGFVAASVGRIVERVLRQEDAHQPGRGITGSFRLRSRSSSSARFSGDSDSIVA